MKRGRPIIRPLISCRQVFENTVGSPFRNLARMSRNPICFTSLRINPLVVATATPNKEATSFCQSFFKF